MSADWLGEAKPEQKAGLPAVVALPDDYTARLALLEGCWARLTDRQRTFLAAWREGKFNAREAERACGLDRRIHSTGMQTADYSTVARIWRAGAAAAALDRDRLLARHDGIVEEALKPKPILHMGAPTGYEEVELGTAARANETLMKVAGMFPKEGADVGVAVQLPAITVELTTREAERGAQATVIDVDPTPPDDDGWLS